MRKTFKGRIVVSATQYVMVPVWYRVVTDSNYVDPDGTMGHITDIELRIERRSCDIIATHKRGNTEVINDAYGIVTKAMPVLIEMFKKGDKR